MRFKANPEFHKVFGAECLLELFPALLSVGVEVTKVGEYYYISHNGVVASDSAFFSQEEFTECLEEVKR